MNSETRWSVQDLRSALNSYEQELRAAGKTRNTISTYVQHPERFINWLDGRYHPAPVDPEWKPGRTASDRDTVAMGEDAMSAGSSRYDPLRRYLEGRSEPVAHLSFAEIEHIIGGPLPASARRHRPWWANERSGTHVHAIAWMSAGRRTANVNLGDGSVDFAL